MFSNTGDHLVYGRAKLKRSSYVEGGFVADHKRGRGGIGCEARGVREGIRDLCVSMILGEGGRWCLVT